MQVVLQNCVKLPNSQDEISRIRKGRKRDGYKQLPVSVEFTKYGNTLFRPVIIVLNRAKNILSEVCMIKQKQHLIVLFTSDVMYKKYI